MAMLGRRNKAFGARNPPHAQASTLCLLPGLLCDAALWRQQIEALKGLADCQVADLSRDDSLAGMAARALADLPPRFAQAGFSMGGFLAFEILRQAPERVARLALLDTRASPDDAADLRRGRALLDLATSGPFRAVTEALLPLYLHESRLAETALTETLHAMAERLGPEAFARQQAAIMSRPDSRPLLAEIRCPTPILCGRQDAAATLAAHEAMAAGTPGAELVVIEICGHFAPLERPAAVNGAMEGWLE